MNFGIIADGNRRWARGNNLEVKEGHFRGFIALKDQVVPVLLEAPAVSSLTIYAFSTENWKRSLVEVKSLMTLFEKVLEEWLPELLEKEICLIHVGRKDRISKKLLQQIEKVENQTKKLKKLTIYLCLDYGGQNEIIRTIKKLKSIESNEKDFGRLLEVPSLDIMLRTGGEQRLSNFCIWQLAYAELFFIEKKLPDLTKKDVQGILDEFDLRQRRRGE